MTATTKTKPLSEDELRPAVEELLDEIVNGDDSHWQKYCEALAAETAAGMKLGLFKVWSSNNRFYLAAQAKRRGDSVQGIYAGIEQWRKRGREIREGETPFVIFGPPSFLVRDRNNAAPAPGANGAQHGAGVPANQQAPTPQPVAMVRAYRRPPRIEVYDYTQTFNTDPDFIEPDWSVPLAGGDLGTLHRLTQTSPVPVRYTNLGSKMEHGWLNQDGITIDDSRTVSEQISTLAHELGHHHLGHLERVESTRGSYSEEHAERAQCEQEAAMTQFLVMKMLGLDESVGLPITKAAGSYLRSWMKTNDDGTTTPIAGHKGRRKLLKARFDTAYKAASTIVAAYAQYDAEGQTVA